MVLFSALTAAGSTIYAFETVFAMCGTDPVDPNLTVQFSMMRVGSFARGGNGGIDILSV